MTKLEAACFNRRLRFRNSYVAYMKRKTTKCRLWANADLNREQCLLSLSTNSARLPWKSMYQIEHMQHYRIHICRSGGDISFHIYHNILLSFIWNRYGCVCFTSIWFPVVKLCVWIWLWGYSMCTSIQARGPIVSWLWQAIVVRNHEKQYTSERLHLIVNIMITSINIR